MTNYKDLINNFTEKDFENNVNLHIHTTYSDGSGTVEEIVQSAKEKGFRYFSISDHNTVNAYLETNLLQEPQVIPAVEFDCWCGYVFMHLLGYGIDVKNEELSRFMAKSKKETELDIIRIFSTRNIKKLIQAIHNANGIAVLAHPACCWALSLDSLVKKLIGYGLDGIEVYYPYERHRGIIKFHTKKSVERIADKYNLIKTGGTDCHKKSL